MCIEREQPSTALKTMPHFTTYGGSYFSAGPDVYHPEFQPEGDDFMKLGDIKGEFASKHDPLTGLDTGSGNDRFDVVGGPQGSQILTGDGLDTFTSSGSPEDQLQLDTGSGNDRFMGFDTGYDLNLNHAESLDSRLINHDDFLMVNNIGSTSMPGGMNYAEAVGLDSFTVDVMNNVISTLQPANEFI